MVKVIIFDLDGVLVDTRELHYETMNIALGTYGYTITREEHLSKYDGNPTKFKLDLLSKEKGLPAVLHGDIWRAKQEATQLLLKEFIKPNPGTVETLRELSKQYKIFVASNSIWQTVKNSLLHAGLLEFVDFFASCEDVRKPKPSAELYLKCFAQADIGPADALIVEDSPVGIKAAMSSGAHVLPVAQPSDVTLDKILGKLNEINVMNPQEQQVKPHLRVNVVIPMAGMGSRFAVTGKYVLPKPLIDVMGKPMIHHVVDNIGVKGQYIFIVQKEHYDKFHLHMILNAVAPGCKIVITNGVTDGAACSVLLAKKYIDNDCPLLIANSDQYLEWNAHEFLYRAMSQDIDGCISTFHNDSNKFSYARLDKSTGLVNQIAEKKVISEHATTGVYFWKFGYDFVKFAEQMIASNDRVNNEFYVAPVYNHAIEHGKRIKIVPCHTFHCLGTPKDLEKYLATKSEQIPVHF